MDVIMLAERVAKSDVSTVVTLKAVPDPTQEGEPEGVATIVIPRIEGDDDPDAADGSFEEGKVYKVSFAESSAPKGSPLETHVKAAGLAAQAANIRNSTNDPNYKTPAEQKVPPPPLPEGVVTQPRPSVVVEPVSDDPPTAGVASSGPVVGTSSTATHTPAHSPGAPPAGKPSNRS